MAEGAPGSTTIRKMKETVLIREVAAVFIRLGAIAFGGPAAHIALMHDEVCRRRRWVS